VVAGLTIPALGGGGAVTIWNSAGTVSVVVDVVGYFFSGSGGTGRYHPSNGSICVYSPAGVVNVVLDVTGNPGQTLANLILVAVGGDRIIDLGNAQGSINAVVDTEGWLG